MASENDFEAVASVSQIPSEGVLAIVKSDGQRVCLIRSRDRISAVADNCTHQDFEMALGDVLPDGTIQCAWHGARFDCATGEVKQGPAVRALPVFEVRIEGNDVLVGPLAAGAGLGHEACVANVSAEGR
jgi:3-phenylpropionate/trans-cinnamate dioxygenase ferredoxin component